MRDVFPRGLFFVGITRYHFVDLFERKGVYARFSRNDFFFSVEEKSSAIKIVYLKNLWKLYSFGSEKLDKEIVKARVRI